MWARLHDGVEFQFEPGIAAAGHGNRKTHTDYRSDGAGNRRGKAGKAESRFVRGQSDANRKAGLCKSHRRCSERLRISSAASEF